MIVKKFNEFKKENPNEIVFTIEDLENEGVNISLSKLKYYDIDGETEVAYDPTQKLDPETEEEPKKFIFNDEEYKVYNLEKKGQWYNSWFGVIILKEDKPIYVVFLYERSGSDFDEARGILTLRGLEETVTIFFDNGEIKRTKN